MPKPSKQVVIDFIISCLEKGEERGAILVKAGKKWGTSKSAFDRMLKIAKDQHTVKQEAIKRELAEVDKLAAIKARKKAIMTAEERKEYLTKIVKGEVKVPYTEVKWNPEKKKFETKRFVELAGHTARISAIGELNKMEGDYAATKIAATKANGDDLPPAPPAPPSVFDLSKLSMEELETMIKISEKTKNGE